MRGKINAEIRRVSILDEDTVEIGFVFAHPEKGWRVYPGFDELSGDRLESFMNFHGCDYVGDIEDLAPEPEMGIGQTPAENPVWVPIESGGAGPDLYSIDTKRYPSDEEGE